MSRLLPAAGGSVEPFWGLYQQHQKQEIRDILEKYRIGSLKGGAKPVTAQVEDPYKNEPSRHPALLVRSAKPFNGETPAELLVAGPITPVDMFFTRHHLPVPVINTDNYNVTVSSSSGCCMLYMLYAHSLIACCKSQLCIAAPTLAVYFHNTYHPHRLLKQLYHCVQSWQCLHCRSEVPVCDRCSSQFLISNRSSRKLNSQPPFSVPATGALR